MQKQSFTLAILLSFLVSVSSLNSAETETLSRDQLIELRTKLAEFKKNKDSDLRGTLVDKILEMGPKGAEDLYIALDKDILNLTKRYTASLGKKAKSLHRKNFNRSREKEVKEARNVLVSLRSKGDALGKDEIVAKGDPALEKLKELLLISVDEVLSEDEKLQKLRKEILVLGGFADRCQALMPEEKKTSSSRKKKYGKKDLTPPQEKIPFLTQLERQEQVAIVLEVLAPKKDLRLLKDNEKQTPYIDYKESEGILDLNIMRMLLGLNSLGIDIKLCAAARDHSNDMRTKNFFAHESPVKGKKHFTDRARNWGTTANAENIAYGRLSPEVTNMQWFHSPGHHVNMLQSDITVMGLGRSEEHWTQMFSK